MKAGLAVAGLFACSAAQTAATPAEAGAPAAIVEREYRLRDTGIRCIAAPCFSFEATPVDGGAPVMLSGVDLSGVDASPGEVLSGKRIVRGTVTTVPTGKREGRVLKVSGVR
jgi:hypothetical protein